jgi:hypothetical protein
MPQFSDTQFKIIVAGAASALVAGIATLSFCGSVHIAAKPPAPLLHGQNASELLQASNAATSVWAGYLETDARAAGVSPPSVAEMSMSLTWLESHTDKDLAIGDPAIELAGLTVRFISDSATGNSMVTLTNHGANAVAYHLETKTSNSDYVCNNITHSEHNTMMVPANSTEKVSVCPLRPQMTAAISLQSVSLSPLSAYYMQLVPPSLVGVPDKLAKVHHNGLGAPSRCPQLPSAGVKGGLASGKIRWRDLIDFYSRHRCETYSFPLSYRAFTKNNERPLPASDAS